MHVSQSELGKMCASISVSTNPFTRLGCSVVFWATSAVTVTSFGPDGHTDLT